MEKLVYCTGQGNVKTLSCATGIEHRTSRNRKMGWQKESFNDRTTFIAFQSSGIVKEIITNTPAVRPGRL